MLSLFVLPITHTLKSCHKILLGKSPFLVLVKILEHSLPVVNVIEQLPELVDINGACPVCVEHIDHHPTRLLAEH